MFFKAEVECSLTESCKWKHGHAFSHNIYILPNYSTRCHDPHMGYTQDKPSAQGPAPICLSSFCRTFHACSPLFGRRSSLEWTYHSNSGGRLLTRQNGCSVGRLEHRVPQADVCVMVGVHVTLRWRAVPCILLPQRTGTTGIFLQI